MSLTATLIRYWPDPESDRPRHYICGDCRMEFKAQSITGESIHYCPMCGIEFVGRTTLPDSSWRKARTDDGKR